MTPKRPLLFGFVLVSGILVAFTAAAAADEVTTYQRALAEVCTTGVTPELSAQYQRAVAAVDREASIVDVVPHFARVTGRTMTSKQLVRVTTTNPHGKTTDFWGPKPPDLAYANCTQAR